MINCLIANVKFTFNGNSNMMNQQLEKYKNDSEGEITISCKILLR